MTVAESVELGVDPDCLHSHGTQYLSRYEAGMTPQTSLLLYPTPDEHNGCLGFFIFFNHSR